VPPRDFTAADLLPPNACPSLLAAAARFRLGAAPLAGIGRVFDGEEIRSILAKVQAGLSGAEKIDLRRNLSVPDRVIVRRTPAYSDVRASQAKSPPASVPPLVRPGQPAMLVWDGDGIRVVVPVTCLDRGAPGESVRARITPSGTVVRAVVIEAGVLRAMS
jgi:hypothetical protein